MALKIMEQLRKRSGYRHAIDAIDIMYNMHQYFDEAASIPVYINMMETYPQKSDRDKLPILDDRLVAITTKAILSFDCLHHPRTPGKRKLTRTRCGLSGRTLTLPTMNPENRLCTAGDTGVQNFGTANAASTPTNDKKFTIQEPHNIPEDKHVLLFEKHVIRCCHCSHIRVPRRQ